MGLSEKISDGNCLMAKWMLARPYPYPSRAQTAHWSVRHATDPWLCSLHELGSGESSGYALTTTRLGPNPKLLSGGEQRPTRQCSEPLLP